MCRRRRRRHPYQGPSLQRLLHRSACRRWRAARGHAADRARPRGDRRGRRARRRETGARVGIPWLGHTCGRCDYCAAGQENLCEGARFTGYHIDGGLASTVSARPPTLSPRWLATRGTRHSPSLDLAAETFARDLGAVWARPSDSTPPKPSDAAIVFAPVGALVPAALRAVQPGGRVVCAAIHMSNIPSSP